MAGLTDLFAPQQAPDYSSALEGLQGAQDRITQFLQQNAQPQTAPTLAQIGPMALDLMRGGSYSESLGNMIAQQRQQELGNIDLALSSVDLAMKQAELASASDPNAKTVMEALTYFAGDDPKLRAKLFQAGMDDPNDINASNAYQIFGQYAAQYAGQSEIDPNKPFYLDADGNIVPNTAYQNYALTESAAGAPQTNFDVNMPGPISPFEEQFDKDAATIMSEWMVGGGAQDAAKNIQQLTGIVQQLTGDSSLTGPHMLAPEVLQTLFMPESRALMQQAQEVIQRNLRAVLGPQFTAKEGQDLVNRAFDSTLSPEENADRLSRLLNWMVAAAEAKNDAAKYVNEHRTMVGWTGNLPSFADIYDATGIEPPTDGGTQTPTTSGDLPKPASEADYNALAPGTQYIAPDGSLRVKQ